MKPIGAQTRGRSGTVPGLAALAGLVLACVTAPGAAAQRSGDYGDGTRWDGYSVSARVWLDRGQEPVVQRGDRVRVYYRTSADAYVAIFHIDTNGTTRLVHPRSPEENHWVRGERDYRLLFPRSPYWYVDDHPGMGYYFIVASPEPFDFSLLDYSYYDGGWDLHRVGRTVYSDPYVAMDDYVAALVPAWDQVPYALDFTSYHVGEERYDYPRFLCYDCHDFRSYDSWNPYHYACTNFRVVIYDDPYYYPSYRYRGDRVVYVRPPIRRLPRFDFKERADDEPPVPLVATRASNGTAAPRPGVPSDAPRRSTTGIGSGGDAATGSTGRDAVRRSGDAADAGEARRGSGAAGSGTAGAATGAEGLRDAVRRRDSGIAGAGGTGSAGTAGEGGARTGRERTGTDTGRAGDAAARSGSAPTRILVPRRTDEGNETRERRFVPVIPRSGEAAGGTGASGEAVERGETGAAGEGAVGTGSSILRRFIPTTRRDEERGRPVLERRPSSKAAGTAGTTGATGSAGATDGSRAGGAVERGGSGSGGAADVGRAGGVVRRPTERIRGSTGGSNGSAGATGGGAAVRPPVRVQGGSGASRSSGDVVRPPVRVRGGGADASRSSGGAVRRSGSGGSAGRSVRPPVRVRGGGASGSTGGAVRSGGGSSGRSVRPPVRVRSGGSAGASSGGSAGGVVRRSGGSSGSSGSSGGSSEPPVRVRRSGSGGPGA